MTWYAMWKKQYEHQSQNVNIMHKIIFFFYKNKPKGISLLFVRLKTAE